MFYNLLLSKYLPIYLLLFNIFQVVCSENIQYNNVTKIDDLLEEHSKILSRKRRFLIFPEGSSMQLVFCLTYPTIFNIGEIFLFGHTAALAWELPQDPYSPYRHHADPLHRRVDTKNIYYTNSDGRILFKKPYKRKSILYPAFAKRSVTATPKSEAYPASAAELKKLTGWDEIHQRNMHETQRKREFLKSEHMGERDVLFHRTSRAGLYRKMEAMIMALGSDGRQCLLKTLCQVGQSQDKPQGSFLEELLRAVFTLPSRLESETDHKEYDAAHLATGSCELLYPGCDTNIVDPTMPLFSY